MSSFYEKYRHLFENDSNIKLPTLKPKYSDYQLGNFEGVHKSKSKSILPLKQMGYKAPIMKYDRAQSQNRPDYNDIKERLFPKWNEEQPKYSNNKCTNLLKSKIFCAVFDNQFRKF